MTFIRRFEDIKSAEVQLVGGKGLSLGLMAQAGLPVPPGFCLTTFAYLHGRTAEGDCTSDLQFKVLEAYRLIGEGPVAVRSSATAEDGQEASFAGQQETLLGIEGPQELLAAVRRCWESLHTERARAYREKQSLPEADLTMAVVVQRMVPAEVSGVLFTRDPLDESGQQMLVEATWGLGESVVSGRVVPDRFHLHRDTTEVIDRHIHCKSHQLTGSGVVEVSEALRNQPCLDSAQLAELAALGQKVEAYYGDARDIEWAWADGKFWLLQARPITTVSAYERAQVLREELQALRSRAEPTGTVWAKYNLAEILPAPTPMTWAIVREFMSGRGGYGLMLRDLGFDPDPIIDEEGFIDLVCGRPYVNLSREPKLYFRDFPSSHPFAALKATPEKAMYPQALPDREKVNARFLLRLPVILWKMIRNYSLMQRQSRIWAERLRTQIFPQFAAAVSQEGKVQLSALADQELLHLLHRWIKNTLHDFARESLRPSVFAALAMANLEQALKRKLGAERAASAVREALTGVHPDPEADLPSALEGLVQGELTSAEFLDRFGHRGPQEMELAQPRWQEAPQKLPCKESETPLRLARPTPSEERWARLLQQAGLGPKEAGPLRHDFELAQTYAGLRETSKHYLMMGYAQIRRILLELDRRHELRGGIFYLEPTELKSLIAGTDLRSLIKERQRRRQLALSLEVPAVLFSDDLEAIGRPVGALGATELQGIPLSAGVAEGSALVLTEPSLPPNSQDYILVCPSTDPAWVPLFLHARALVMESGGVLSHGAIVAREFGLPAVAGLPSIHQRLRTGQKLKVDGNTGKLFVYD